MQIFCFLVHQNPLKFLFAENDLVLVQKQFKEDEVDGFPCNTFNRANLADFQYFVINPGLPDQQTKDAHDFKLLYNFCLETDTVDTSSMLRFLNSLDCLTKPRLVTHSAGKSLHLIFSCNTPVSPNNYKTYWKALYKELTHQYKRFCREAPEIIFDRSTSNCNRLSRLPGGYRDGKFQAPLLMGDFVTEEYLQELTIKYPEKVKSTINVIDKEKTTLYSLNDMERYIQVNPYCPRYLHKWLTPEKWIKPENNRDQILKDLLTLFDFCNVENNVIKQFFDKHLEPYMRSINYVRDHAYLIKQAREYHSKNK